MDTYAEIKGLNTKDIISGTHTITCTATTGAGKKATISKDINLIAVGVENKRILDTLKLVGVRLVQGFYFGKPSPDINMMNENIFNLLNSEEDQSIM